MGKRLWLLWLFNSFQALRSVPGTCQYQQYTWYKAHRQNITLKIFFLINAGDKCVTWLMNVLRQQGDRESRRANTEQTLSKKLGIKQTRHTKNLQKRKTLIWSPDQLPLFQMCFFKVCALKGVTPIQPSEYGEVCSLHIHSNHTDTHTHTQNFSSSCEIKGRVWHNIDLQRCVFIPAAMKSETGGGIRITLPPN